MLRQADLPTCLLTLYEEPGHIQSEWNHVNAYCKGRYRSTARGSTTAITIPNKSIVIPGTITLYAGREACAHLPLSLSESAITLLQGRVKLVPSCAFWGWLYVAVHFGEL